MKNAKVSKALKRKNILDRPFALYSDPVFAIQTWDGWFWSSSQNQLPVFTVEFRTPNALRHLLFDPNEWTLGKAFIEGDLKVEGGHSMLDRLSFFRHSSASVVDRCHRSLPIRSNE